MADTNSQQAKPPRTLVITRSTFFDIDKIVAAIVLGKILTRFHHNQVDLYFGEKVPLASLTNIVAPQDVSFREKLSPDFFTVSIHRGSAKIKEVKWEEVGEDLNLIIYTDQGQINADDYQLTTGIPKYENVYTLGIKTKEEALNALGEFAPIWQSSHTCNLDIRSENQRYAEKNFIYADGRSFAESVFKFAKENEIEVTNAEATELLSCIYWKTNSLRNKYTTFDTLGTVQEMIQNGGSVSEAVTRIFSTLSIVEIRARQEIYKSMKLTSEKIAFAQVTPETAHQLTKIQPINPEKNPLFKLKDAVTSFVMIPLGERKTLVLCSSRDEKVNIKRLFSNYNYVGDELQSELMFNMNVADTEKEIKRLLVKVFPQAQNKEQVEKETFKQQPQQQSQPQPQQQQRINQPRRDDKPGFVVSERKPLAPPQPIRQPEPQPQYEEPKFEAPSPEMSRPELPPIPEPDQEFTDQPQEQPMEMEYDQDEEPMTLPTGFVDQVFPEIQMPPMAQEQEPTHEVSESQQSFETQTEDIQQPLPEVQSTNFAFSDEPLNDKDDSADMPTNNDVFPPSPEIQDMVMVEMPPPMGDLGPADPLPSAN